MSRPLYPWPEGLALSAVPAVVLIDPKYPHNVGQTVRICAAFGAQQVVYTGDRMEGLLAELGRLPREERLRAYKHVGLERDEKPLDRFMLTAPFKGRRPPPVITPVCVEVDPTAEELPWFEHPGFPVYVFGPEDGSIPKAIRAACHRFVTIPSAHCLNLATAVGVVLYDRLAKEQVPHY